MKKLLSLTLALALALTMLAGCGQNATVVETQPVAAANPTEAPTEPAAKTPKYVFLFIGDGMSYPQFQAAADYLGAMADDDYMMAEPSLDDNQGATLDGPVALNFMQFPVAGSAVTYDSNSFAPDSASTATSISTGHKTYSGSINVDETATVKYETITEKVHDQLGMKVGIISSVNLNHATPAAFYAHQASRNDYYEIGLELIDSGFEFYAGGGLKKVTGNDKDKENLYDLAQKAGYTVVKTQAEAEKVTTGPVIIIDENLADGDAMAYDLDRSEGMWSLADWVEKGIEVLDNDNGFFMMCEGGKIDWACHANDAASTVTDTLALADAVQVAVDFAKTHADETLILVTGDHETGGLTIGYAGTDYDTYLTLLDNQKISFQAFDDTYIAKYKKDKTSFEDVMKDVETLFGLKMTGDEKDKMVLTEYEKSILKTAYEKNINEKDTGMTEQQEYVLYSGEYQPLTVIITRILNNKSGVDFTSYSHTGLPVAVFADGVGADEFGGYYDTTAIYQKMASLLNVK